MRSVDDPDLLQILQRSANDLLRAALAFEEMSASFVKSALAFHMTCKTYQNFRDYSPETKADYSSEAKTDQAANDKSKRPDLDDDDVPERSAGAGTSFSFDFKDGSKPPLSLLILDLLVKSERPVHSRIIDKFVVEAGRSKAGGDKARNNLALADLVIRDKRAWQITEAGRARYLELLADWRERYPD
jgi:hypothetical protein